MKASVKKLSAFAMILGSVAGLTGCSENDGKIHISIGMWPETQQTSDVAMFTVWKNKFEADHPEYVIEDSPYTYDQDTVAARAMGETLPTIFQTYFTEPKMLIQNRYIREVTSLVKEVGYYDDMNPFMRETLEDDQGNLYGVPRDGYGVGMLLNLKTLNYYGLIDGDATKHEYQPYDDSGNPLYPTTYDELLTMCSEISSRSNGTVRGTLMYSANKQGGWLLSNFAWAFGAELEVQENGKWRGNLNCDGVVDALSYIAELRINDCLPDGTSYTYNDWYNNINSKIAIAFCGNDVIQNACTQAKVDRQDLAFVPMPEGPGGRYSLYGGTPFVFAANATDEQVKGALLFLEYMGRSPIMSDVQRQAMIDGKETSKRKNEPILPSIYPWTNQEFQDYSAELESQYVNINREYFDDFYTSIDEYKHEEVKYYAQEMYDLLDQAVIETLKNPYRSKDEIRDQLTSLNTEFQKNF